MGAGKMPKLLYRLVLVVDGVPIKGAATEDWPIVTLTHDPQGRILEFEHKNEREEPGFFVAHADLTKVALVGVEVVAVADKDVL